MVEFFSVTSKYFQERGCQHLICCCTHPLQSYLCRCHALYICAISILFSSVFYGIRVIVFPYFLVFRSVSLSDVSVFLVCV
jgi:hypothetical protein